MYRTMLYIRSLYSYCNPVEFNMATIFFSKQESIPVGWVPPACQPHVFCCPTTRCQEQWGIGYQVNKIEQVSNDYQQILVAGGRVSYLTEGSTPIPWCMWWCHLPYPSSLAETLLWKHYPPATTVADGNFTSEWLKLNWAKHVKSQRGKAASGTEFSRHSINNSI